MHARIDHLNKEKKSDDFEILRSHLESKLKFSFFSLVFLLFIYATGFMFCFATHIFVPIEFSLEKIHRSKFDNL